MKKSYTFLAAFVILLEVVLLYQSANLSHAEPVHEVVHLYDASSTFDTSPLDAWCSGEEQGTTRMIGAWRVDDKLIEDEEGNIWEYSFEESSIGEDDFLLLWINDSGTPLVVQDDVVVKVWKECY